MRSWIAALALALIVAGCAKPDRGDRFVSSQPVKPGKIIPPDVWNESVDPERLNGRVHGTFDSATLGEKVSYLVYLPPSYASSPNRRYPVLYWLHGMRGGLLKGSIFYDKFRAALDEGKAPEMIIVFPKGRHASMYCDSTDSKRPVETVTIKELIPHIDATYRTVPKREGRAIEGSSMGGFGAVHLAFKYPDLFCATTAIIGALYEGSEFVESPSDSLAWTFGGDIEAFKRESPWRLIDDNLEDIRGKMTIRFFPGSEDRLFDCCNGLHEKLSKLGVAHTFVVTQGIGHNQQAVYAGLGSEGFVFYRELFGDIGKGE